SSNDFPSGSGSTSGSSGSFSPSLPSVSISGTPGLSRYPSANGAGFAYFSELGAHDLASLKRLACAGTTIKLTQTQVDQVTSAIPSGTATVTGTSATMKGQVTASDGSTAGITAFLSQESNGWCLNKTAAS
ncbi:MAG: hypothetical protein QOJ78_1525, partial [Pseudonocardiales bacterium]|nr:hypothetical protein [Pseudonocardiales bacterium]